MNSIHRYQLKRMLFPVLIGVMMLLLAALMLGTKDIGVVDYRTGEPMVPTYSEQRKVTEIEWSEYATMLRWVKRIKADPEFYPGVQEEITKALSNDVVTKEEYYAILSMVIAGDEREAAPRVRAMKDKLKNLQ
jgi:hypothetical protein